LRQRIFVARGGGDGRRCCGNWCGDNELINGHDYGYRDASELLALSALSTGRSVQCVAADDGMRHVAGMCHADGAVRDRAI
jgi:hypothetical protein